MRLARCLIFGVVILFTWFALTPSASAQDKITIAGSDTLIFLGQRLAEIYRLKHPQTIRVGGGGKSKAVSQIQSGQAEIAEFEGASGTAGPDLASFAIGIQTIVVYVNESNKIKELTMAQLRGLFLGEITNWKMLGGPDLVIHLYAGESSTGTLDYFQESVLQGQEPYPFVGKNNTKALLEEVASHPEAIGYGSLSQAPGVRALPIKIESSSVGISPSSDNIRSRKYPITRSVWWALPRNANGATRKLCEWVLSDGQLVVESVGFEPLRPVDRTLALSTLVSSSSSQPARSRP